MKWLREQFENPIEDRAAAIAFVLLIIAIGLMHLFS